MPSCGSHCKPMTKTGAGKKPAAKKAAASKPKPKAKPRKTASTSCCYSKTGGCGTARSKKAPAKSRKTRNDSRRCGDYSSCSDSSSCSCSDCLTDGYDSYTDSSDSYTGSSSSSDEGYYCKKCRCGK